MADDDNVVHEDGIDPAIIQAKDELVAKAKKDGKIDQRDIFKAIADTPENIDALDQLYTELADANIEIAGFTEPNAESFKDEWAQEAEEEEIVPEVPVYLDDISDDSVRLYLREIGKIPLLTAEQELALAQRVVAGEKD